MAKPRTPKGRAREAVARLATEYPGKAAELCALRHENPFQLLVATILSAQTTDERVNQVTPALFGEYPTAADLAAADPGHVEEIIHPTGFFRAKARSLVSMAQALDQRHGGQVPPGMEDLVTLPGVGRKTANVVRSVAFGLPGLPVDTHVGRLSRRLGLTVEEDPVKVEAELNAMVPATKRGALSLRLILHGRRVCLARRPRCETCLLNDFCPSSTVPTKRQPARRVRNVNALTRSSQPAATSAGQLRKGENALVTSRDGRALTVAQREPAKMRPGPGNKEGGPGVPID
jgi:endonuclease III